jgi:hypothetical protein
MAPPPTCSTVCSDPVLIYIHQLLVLSVGLEFLVCFGLLYAWYVHGTVVGRHGETGESLSTNHVYPVGNAASVLRY